MHHALAILKGRFPLLFGLILLTSTLAFAEDAAALRVMSFNIRYGTAKDGENHWDRRKEFLVETIRNFRPDLLGTQETVGVQRDYLAKALPEHDVLGVGRDDGAEAGEMMAIYFRKDRFEVLEKGHFWLSETPDVAGSKSWDSSLPRMATWVRLRDRSAPGKPVFTWFNTHFDHMGKESRLQAARILRSRVESLHGEPGLITGDFNSAPESPPYQALFALTTSGTPLLTDSFKASPPLWNGELIPAGRDATANAFDPKRRTGGRIDWIAITSQFRVQSTAINYVQKDGRVPSDHFPIEAVIEWKATKPAN